MPKNAGKEKKTPWAGFYGSTLHFSILLLKRAFGMLAHKCPATLLAFCLLGLQLGHLGMLSVMAEKQVKHSHLVFVDGNCWRKRVKEMKGTRRKSEKDHGVCSSGGGELTSDIAKMKEMRPGEKQKI